MPWYTGFGLGLGLGLGVCGLVNIPAIIGHEFWGVISRIGMENNCTIMAGVKRITSDAADEFRTFEKLKANVNKIIKPFSRLSTTRG